MLSRIKTAAARRAAIANTASADRSTRPGAPPKPGGRSGLERARRRARLRKFLAAYRPHLPLLAADVGCALLVAITALLLPLSANFVSRALAATPLSLAPIAGIGALMLVAIMLQAAASLFVDYRGHLMGARIETTLRQELFEHCQRLSFSFHDRERVGQLMSRITNDLFLLGELYHHGPEDLLIGLLKLTGATLILATIDGPLTLAILAVLPVALAYALFFSRRMGIALDRTQAEIAAVNERVEDTLSGIRVVQSFANEGLENERFSDRNLAFLASRGAGYRSEAFFSIGTTVFPQLITLIVIIVGAVRVVDAKLGVGDLLTFLLCVAVLVDPVQRLANFNRLWQGGLAGFNRVMEILEVAPEIDDRPGAIVLARPRGAITFRQVSFRYDDERPHVLRDLSLDIRSGEFVALVGPSGAGKTTLCGLIPRFYEVGDGAILIDGIDIRDVTLASLRRQIGLVQQDVYLFAGSVADNIGYGRPGASSDEIVAAAKAAHAHEFIAALAQGYDTDIGQRGVRLSGGQKQRLTIARAFLKDPPILLFDEATSALDNESEAAVQAALGLLARSRTTLVIAHRLTTIRHADRIIVLTEDGIAEDGTHDGLMAARGVYARLYAAQARM